MRSWLGFGDLAEGDRFRFVYGAGAASLTPRTGTVTYVKGKRGWYRTALTNGARTSTAWFRTSAATAVERVTAGG